LEEPLHFFSVTPIVFVWKKYVIYTWDGLRAGKNHGVIFIFGWTVPLKVIYGWTVPLKVIFGWTVPLKVVYKMFIVTKTIREL